MNYVGKKCALRLYSAKLCEGKNYRCRILHIGETKLQFTALHRSLNVIFLKSNVDINQTRSHTQTYPRKNGRYKTPITLLLTG